MIKTFLCTVSPVLCSFRLPRTIWRDSEAAYLIAKEYLSGFDGMDIDTLILGCTHYPLLEKNTVRRVMGDNIALIDAGKSTADFAAQKLHSEKQTCRKESR
ncbi:MAG: hypothetical protein L6V93_21425 [Clostridiales bacterium]|nr:MAG: hypothetical protein L6V93_21425 [Clostridiales bacterium]